MIEKRFDEFKALQKSIFSSVFKLTLCSSLVAIIYVRLNICSENSHYRAETYSVLKSHFDQRSQADAVNAGFFQFSGANQSNLEFVRVSRVLLVTVNAHENDDWSNRGQFCSRDQESSSKQFVTFNQDQVCL